MSGGDTPPTPASHAGPTVRSRLLLDWWVVLLAALCLAALAVHEQWTARLDHAAYDLALAGRAREDAGKLLIVAIDEPSLDRVGPWPWPRATQAALIDRLAAARPRALGLDLLLVEPRDPAGDAALAAALATAARQGVVIALPAAFRVPGANGAPFAVEAPLPLFARAGARVGPGVGHVNLAPDADGVVRRFHPAYTGAGSTWPSLGAILLGHAAPALSARGPHLAGSPPLLVDWLGPPGTVPRVPASAVLAGEVPATLIAGRTVFVGLTASGLGDYHATPVGGGGLMPGVEIQANVLSTLASPRPLRPAGEGLALAFTLLPLALLFAAMRFLRPGWTGAVAVGLALALVALSLVLLRGAALWVSPVTAVLALGLAWPLWAWVRLVVTGRFIARELERTAAEAGTPTVPATTSVLDRELALLEAATLRERRLRAEHDEVIRLLSHDMRAPQSAILSLTEGHADAPLPAEARARIRDQARRTLALADGFVHLSRAQLLDYAPEPVDLVALATDAADALWALARDRGTAILVAGPADDEGGSKGEPVEVLVLGEASLLHRAIANLAENALKYGDPAEPIRIDVTSAGGEGLLEVRNAGPAIAPECQAALFARFSRADPGGSRQGGVGLGLAFVHAVARRHGGSVSCRSAAGETAFTLRLPLRAER